MSFWGVSVLGNGAIFRTHISYVSRPNRNPSKNCRTGLKWQIAVIGCLWDQWYLLWESRLSLISQLNVDADDKAKEFQHQYGKAHPFVLMSPHAGAFVTLSEGTITSKVVKELRNHATGPPLRLHIQQRNDWTDHTMELINWKAHGKAFNGMIGKRVHLTKLVHEILPTFRRLNKLTKSERKCPACNNAEETRDHIIRCQHDKRARWRTAFMTAIEGFHAKENTSPLLRHVWREAMELWFAADTDVVHVSPVLFPPEVRRVIMHQNEIGWRQVFNGRFAIAWSTVQEDYLARHNVSSGRNNTQLRKKGKQWQKKFILEIWKQWMTLWKARNDLVHGKDTTAQNEANRRRTAEELRAIYDRREQLEPEYQRLLYSDVQDHLQRHRDYTTRNWVNTNAPILRESLRRAKRRAVAGVRSIRSYFAPVR
ncbi:hypothetical protein MHU86_15388 [Fragilaria crotonensis]|nr:hypothetical protein MHU86_15388 [Fragilaria crotonensis]